MIQILCWILKVLDSEAAEEIRPCLALEEFTLLSGRQTSTKVEAISATTHFILNTSSGLCFSYNLVQIPAFLGRLPRFTSLGLKHDGHSCCYWGLRPGS